MRGFVDFRSAREVVILAPGRKEEARWWRAVSQRVPRDAYRRIAKTDVLGLLRIPGEEMPCIRPNRSFAKARATRNGSPCRGDSRAGTYEKPEPVRSRLCVANLRRKSPPGSEAVRSGESSSHPVLCTESSCNSTELPDRLHEPARTRALGVRNPR